MRATPVNGGMYVSQIASIAELRHLEADWNQLTSGIPFRSYQWLVTWWEHYGNNVNAGHRNSLLVLAVYDSKDRSKLIAIAPCYVEYRWSEGRVVCFLGSGEVCSEYLSVLCRTGFESQVARQLVDWLTGPGADQWDAIEFSDVASDEPVVCEMAQQAIAVGHRVCRYSRNGCWKLQLPDSWDEYLSGLSKSHRKRVRQIERRKLDTERVEFRRVTARDQLPTAITTLVHLHQRRRAELGQKSCLDSERFVAFLRAAAERMFDLGMLHLNLLELDGRIVAADYNLVSDAVVYGFQGGIDPDVLGDEPGNLLTIATIRDAISNGYCAYDLLRGDEPYKAHWRAELQQTFGIRVVNTSLVAHVRHGTWFCRHKTFQWARQLAFRVRDFRKTGRSSNDPCRDLPRQPRTEIAAVAGSTVSKACLARNPGVATQRDDCRQRLVAENETADQQVGGERIAMRLEKRATLGLYYYATAPLRQVRNRMLAAAGRAPVMILMYHRVADDVANAWTTHSDVFARQMQWLQRRFDMISLSEAQQRLRQSANYRPAVSITFDDGYAVNCQRALPLLIDVGIPVTYFVTSNAVLRGAHFEHDLVMGNRFEPNSLQQLKSLAAAGVEIGAHTRTHADLGAIHDEATLYDEIVTAGQELEDALGRRVRYCAFPFGQHRNLNRRGFQIAAGAGYQAVVSAYGGYNFPGDDTFHMQRMGVDGPMIRLKNWTTLDPFKQWKIVRYEYRSTETKTPSDPRSGDCGILPQDCGRSPRRVDGGEMPQPRC